MLGYIRIIINIRGISGTIQLFIVKTSVFLLSEQSHISLIVTSYFRLHKHVRMPS